eukprot:13175707-Ditylum_brightwellii.AAC.2
MALMSPDLPAFKNNGQDKAAREPTSDFVPLDDVSPPIHLEGNNASMDDNPTPVPLYCSTRQRKMSRRAMESLDIIDVDFTAEYYDAMHKDDYRIQNLMQDPIAFKASTDPDTLYYHQAIAAPDHEDFIGTIVKEINGNIEKKH